MLILTQWFVLSRQTLLSAPGSPVFATGPRKHVLCARGRFSGRAERGLEGPSSLPRAAGTPQLSALGPAPWPESEAPGQPRDTRPPVQRAGWREEAGQERRVHPGPGPAFGSSLSLLSRLSLLILALHTSFFFGRGDREEEGAGVGVKLKLSFTSNTFSIMCGAPASRSWR